MENNKHQETNDSFAQSQALKNAEQNAEQKRKVEAVKRRHALKELDDKLSQVKLTLVLEMLGADHEPRDKRKWKVPGYATIINKGQAWKNVHTEKSGFGGVFLVEQALGLSREEAIKWMVDKFGEDISDEMKANLDDPENKKSEFTPPENEPNYINVVRKYLTEERGIPPSLINELIEKDKIYSDKKRNCVFISQAAAEVRSTSGIPFKGCCEGSQTDISFFRVMQKLNANEKIVALIEASIDAISYNAMFPGRFAASTNGSGRFNLQYKIAIEALDNGYKVKAAQDADWAGDYAAQKLFNAIYIRKVLSHRLKLDMSIVDEWILNGSIEFDIEKSPHHNFFSEGWEEKKAVYETERYRDPNSEEIKIIEKQYDTGEELPPSIKIRVVKDLHPEVKKGESIYPVGKKAYEGIINNIGLARERPVNRKDWNDEMQMLGSKFTLDYERCYALDFKEVPVLPNYLEQLRSGNPLNNVLIDKNGIIHEPSSKIVLSIKEDRPEPQKNKFHP